MLEARDLVVCARAWAKARARCRRIADSRSASKRELEKAKEALSRASDDLARAVEAFDRSVSRGGGNSRKSANWPKIFDAVGTFASALENVVREKPPIAIGVIDTTGEEVLTRPRKRGPR